MQNKQEEPSESITDNLTGDLIDSMITGVAANLIVKLIFGKSPTLKNVLNKELITDGAKLGISIGAYRRVGRPLINNMMNRSNMGEMLAL